jgi:thioredoxin:protein disulfide reductase
MSPRPDFGFATRPVVLWAFLLSSLVLMVSAWSARAQLGGPGVPDAQELVHVTAEPVTIAAGGRSAARVTLRVREGWHINANPPALDYLIPTVVRLDANGGVSAIAPVYPPPHQQKLAFEEKPLLVYDHDAVVTLPLIAARDAATGSRALNGTVSFQSCNDEVCLAPASVPFQVAVTVEGVAAQGSSGPPGATDAGASSPGGDAPSVTGSGVAGRSSAPGAAAGLMSDPISRMIAGGSLAAFLGLFAIGLALNLTPCVYPMLGVTLSIFGARRAAPPSRVFGLALLYVLGMAVMYSSLGVVAALTGRQIGAALQSPVLLGVIGALFFVLALSMFGLYELQPPPWMLERVGGAGTTSAVGIFLSGLVVGVIAAPCVGPPVVALLALVGAKGDPWFGFKTFFTLAMGLGAPYLVLGTFSNLLQRLPRSGDWMVWVKKVFGVIMLSVGTFYILLAVAPRAAFWILPVALVAGGIYLGAFAGSPGQKAGFRRIRWAVGGLAAAAGIAVLVTTPSQGIAFEPFDEQRLARALREGRPVMLDFTANWCVPCHELERFTFTDRRVLEATRGFRAFQVDLTRYDSPEAERWRRQYEIAGPPTVIFIAPDGREVREARVVGFLGPEPFLERVRMAGAAGERAAR